MEHVGTRQETGSTGTFSSHMLLNRIKLAKIRKLQEDCVCMFTHSSVCIHTCTYTHAHA